MTPNHPISEVEARIAEFVQAVDQLTRAHYEKNLPALAKAGKVPHHELQKGPKYIRVVTRETDGGGAVYCFLNWNGDIFKADGWKRPAKHVRGSIFDDNYSIGKGLTVYGGTYLR